MIWVVAAAAIGWIVGLMFWGFVLSHIAARLQGWPFAVGERVWVLSGSSKNTITTVYAVWAERGPVRLELGAKSKEDCDGVYCAVAICRARNT